MELIITEKNQWQFYVPPRWFKKTHLIPASQSLEYWDLSYFLKALLEIHFASVKDDI